MITDTPLTKRQREVLNVIIKYQEQNGYTPSCSEIAEDLGICERSTASISLHLLALEDKGYIARVKNKVRNSYRAIIVLKK